MRTLAPTDETIVTLRVPADVAAPGAGRRAVREALDGRLGREALRDVLLVVSELMANGVLHGGPGASGGLELRVRIGADSVCVKVTDGGPGFGAAAGRATREPGAVGGHGLGIVDRLASDWGHERRDGRTVVWAELPREP